MIRVEGSGATQDRKRHDSASTVADLCAGRRREPVCAVGRHSANRDLVEPDSTECSVQRGVRAVVACAEVP